ncbi:hypothetical protein CUU66_05485 [Peribacillus deserti]|uniref:Uncharacterized protein n=1 Tax=Peribacillus deserti TaxID=673318 RepID=A0A2N5M909_9BACI|nr:hypothetical protein CUU66_05485 [Peribacillus deserti]
MFFNKIYCVTLLFSQVDWSVRCETPAGAALIKRALNNVEGECSAFRSGETPQAKPEEAHRPPRGKRASWSGN